MAEKVHQEKIQGIQTRLTYGESSHRNSQTRLKKKRPKKRRQSPATASRGTRPSQTANVFSRLRHERDKPTHRRSPVSATVFTRLGPGDKNVFTRLGERKRGVHSRLGPEDVPRYRRVSRKRSTSKQEIEEEWNTADRSSRRPYTRTEELYYSENDHDQGGHWKSKTRRVWFDKLPPESIDNYEMLRKAFLGNYSQQKKYIKDPVESHHIKQREGESTEAFMERFKAKSMHVSGAPECMRISRFMDGLTNPDLIKKAERQHICR
ncbi:reverse transcriptase domain-containing protein [Tanacetum coccineum]